jgi:3-phosphoshikimate 1-carboxyvinyltransferase
LAGDIAKHKHILISPGNFPEKVVIDLPLSKSESNRAILLLKQVNAMEEGPEFSKSTDTEILLKGIDSDKKEINLQDAGTSFRFLTAWYAAMGIPKKLMGTKRMHERPIKPLVDGLTQLGAKIEYLGKKGFPPLEIKTSTGLKNTGPIKIDSTSSSQFTSALALISPQIKGGLDLEIKGKAVSKPYFKMTLDMIRDFGMTIGSEGKKVKLRGELKTPEKISIDRDWSSAAYYIFLFSILPIKEMLLIGLRADSYQGDRVIIDWLPFLGLEAGFSSLGMELKKTRRTDFPEVLDLNDFPDLGLPVIVLACIRNLEIDLNGLAHLEFKESNRLEALSSELKKVGSSFQIEKGRVSIHTKEEPVGIDQSLVFKSHQDHRIAMSLSLLACGGVISIENPEVVEKSFPNYWKEFKKMGFEISYSDLPPYI